MYISFVLMCIMVVVLLAVPVVATAEQVLQATRVAEAPRVDGDGNDPAWNRAKAISTHDKIAGIDVEITCVNTDTNVYFRVRFPDNNESRLHKPWVWNSQKNKYEMGPQREDTFVFKWAITDGITDLSLKASVPYSSDIWYWKACRTDPVGQADDKIDVVGLHRTKDSTNITTGSGSVFYMQRRGDKGAAAYQSMLPLEYRGDIIQQFEIQPASGSRADIQAKGIWREGVWTIEFARPLVTTHDDDVQFDITKKYFFGISRYEIAGLEPDPKLEQPLHGTGDVSEALYLVFDRRKD